MYPVKFTPVPMPRVWGGHGLKDMFNVDTSEAIGEYWVVSGHPNGMSVVTNGPLAGKTLDELTAEYPEEFLGKSPQPRFPLLIKFLEAERDLSVQIHPDDTYAQENEGDFGKTEAWYVLDAKPDGQVNYGHTFESREAYERAVQEGRVKDYLSYRSVRPGDVLYVPARTLHSLLGGTKVLEVQQTSDVTYRVYDWDRVDDKGVSRQLHVDKAADVLQFEGAAPEVKCICLRDDKKLTLTRHVRCDHFTMDSVVVRHRETLSMGQAGNPDVVIVLEGEGELSAHRSNGAMDDSENAKTGEERLELQPGDAVLVPAGTSTYDILPTNEMKLIRTFY